MRVFLRVNQEERSQELRKRTFFLVVPSRRKPSVWKLERLRLPIRCYYHRCWGLKIVTCDVLHFHYCYRLCCFVFSTIVHMWWQSAVLVIAASFFPSLRWLSLILVATSKLKKKNRKNWLPFFFFGLLACLSSSLFFVFYYYLPGLLIIFFFLLRFPPRSALHVFTLFFPLPLSCRRGCKWRQLWSQRCFSAVSLPLRSFLILFAFIEGLFDARALMCCFFFPPVCLFVFSSSSILRGFIFPLQSQNTCDFFQREACLLIRRVLLPLYLKITVQANQFVLSAGSQRRLQDWKEKKKKRKLYSPKYSLS